MFDIHEDRIDVRHEAEIRFRFGAAFRFDGRIPALGLAGLEQFAGKVRPPPEWRNVDRSFFKISMSSPMRMDRPFMTRAPVGQAAAQSPLPVQTW